MDERLTPPPALGSDVFLRREALAAGFSQRSIDQLVRAGAWHRVRHGAYVVRSVWESADRDRRHALTVRAAVRQARTGVVVSHVSAVVELGAPTWGLHLDTVHLTRLDRRAGRNEAGVRQHQGVLEPGDIVDRNGLLVTSPTRTGLDITTVASTETGLCVVNHLLHTGATTERHLRDRYESMQNHPFTLRTDLVLRLADPRIESVGESRSFHLFWRAGLPMPVPQFIVRGSSDQVIARLDFAWPALRAWVEFDGRTKYGSDRESTSDAVFREKRREDLVREITGWRCLRLTWADLQDPMGTAARIKAFLFVAA